MKVFVLGGYGKVGRVACRLLAQNDLISEIAVAGRHYARAGKLARETGAKAVPVHADGSDEEMLAVLLRPYDLLINAATDDLVLPALRAALRAKKNYCDANVANEQALLLDHKAQETGITAVVANGICPGISSLMGVYAANQLTGVEQLQMGFASIFNWETGHELTPQLWLRDMNEQLALLHECRPFIDMMFHVLEEHGSRLVRHFAGGRWIDRDPLREGLNIPLPQGSRILAFPYASHDPFWEALPTALGSVPPVEIFFTPLPPKLHELLRAHALRVLAHELNAGSATAAFYETLEADPRRLLALPNDFAPPPALWVEAVGEKNGRATRSSCWFAPGMWQAGGYFLTSLALVVAALKILRGDLAENGIMTAEKAFDPLPFLDEAAVHIPKILPSGQLSHQSLTRLPA